MLRIAGVQMNVVHRDRDANLSRIENFFQTARQNGAELVIFPECATSGYCLPDRAAAVELAEEIPGPTTDRLTALCAEQGGQIIVGMLERAGEAVYNASCWISSQGVLARYRKIHLPYLGLDRWVDLGDEPFAVNESSELKLGMSICYDAGFPEAARALALAGADLIALPTNWPTGAELLAEHTINSRALENHVYFAAINRVGTEVGTTFIGRSSICSPTGETLAAASATEEEILYADIDPQRARQKTIVRTPGEQLIDRILDRRPEFYGAVTDAQAEPRPGRDIPASEF